MKLISSNKVDTNRYELVIEVEGTVFMNAVNRVYKKEVKNINIPGFRKGKAPRAVIEKMYGAGVFYEDAIKDLYPMAVTFGANEAGLEMVRDVPDIDVEKADKEALVIKTKITVEPEEVTVEGYKGIEFVPASTEVTDEDVEKEIEQVRQRNSRLVEVTDRPAQSGDTVTIDFKGMVDGKAFDGGTASNYNLTLGSGAFIPGFEDALVGHSTGEEFVIDVAFPENYQVDELKGKPAQFEIKLHKIQGKEIPEFDEEFVKDVSEFDTIDEYKADIREKVADDKKKAYDNDKERQVADKLAELIQAEIPEAMYENQIDNIIDEFSMNLRMQGMDMKTYMQYTGLTEEILHDTYHDQAVSQVKVRLALKKIAQLEGLSATDEEVENKYDELAKSYRVEVEKVKNVFSAKDIKSDLEVAKALEFVKDAAVEAEKKEETAE